MGNFLNEPLAFFISRMCLAGIDELHRPIGGLGELGDFLEVIKNQWRPFVGGKTAGKSDGQRVSIEEVIECNKISFARFRIIDQAAAGEVN